MGYWHWGTLISDKPRYQPKLSWKVTFQLMGSDPTILLLRPSNSSKHQYPSTWNINHQSEIVGGFHPLSSAHDKCLTCVWVTTLLSEQKMMAYSPTIHQLLDESKSRRWWDLLAFTPWFHLKGWTQGALQGALEPWNDKGPASQAATEATVRPRLVAPLCHGPHGHGPHDDHPNEQILCI